MAKYRIKESIAEAWQWTDETYEGIRAFCKEVGFQSWTALWQNKRRYIIVYTPAGVAKFGNGNLNRHAQLNSQIIGNLRIFPGDFVLKSMYGTFHVLKPVVFDQFYEKFRDEKNIKT